MGFIAAVAVPDGIAVASDGRAVAGVGEGAPPTVVSETQQKIVQLAKQVAALIPEPYVIAQGKPHSLRSALEAVRLDLEPSATVDSVAQELPGRLKGLMPALAEDDVRSTLQLKIAGLRDDKSVGIIHLDALEANELGAHSTRDPGLNWYGFGDVATRIVLGHPQTMPIGLDVGPTVQYHIPTLLMSLGDAVSLAEALVEVSATFARYVIALETPDQPDEPAAHFTMPIGGHIHSATLTRDAFRWVQEPVLLEHLGPEASGDSDPR